MSANSQVMHDSWGVSPPEWIAVLAEECDRTSQSKTASRLNVSAAIPAVLLGVGFPVVSLRGVPILARTAGLIAHLAEEAQMPSGFALSYQATREYEYTGELPASERGGAA